MSAIANIRRDLREASYLKHSAAPFAGAMHNFAVPMRKRFESRRYCGPYFWNPTKPGTCRGFYQSGNSLACGDSSFRLRLELANDHLQGSRLAHAQGYYVDSDEGDTLQPIIARLPRGRGFLAGWTMGEGMAAAIDSDIHETEQEAAFAAHDMAERDAERNREREESEDQDEGDDE